MRELLPRMTDTQIAVLEALEREYPEPISALHVASLYEGDDCSNGYVYPRGWRSYQTVYRALVQLLNKGLVEKLQLDNYYGITITGRVFWRVLP